MTISTKRETRTYEIHDALVWCTNSVRRFLRDRQSDVLKPPIVKHVLCALDSERGVCHMRTRAEASRLRCDSSTSAR